jgi:hypothetical protein
MSKGQRGNREAKKPKKVRAPPVPAGEVPAMGPAPPPPRK